MRAGYDLLADKYRTKQKGQTTAARKIKQKLQENANTILHNSAMDSGDLRVKTM